jgi:hypothetical protein
MNLEKSFKDNKLKPIKYILLFNVFTILMLLAAPFKVNYTNLFAFLLLVSVNFIFLYYGFKKGVHRKLVLREQKYDVQQIIKFVFIFYIVTLLIRYGFILKVNPFNFKELFAVISVGVVEPALGYQRTHNEQLVQYIPWTIFFITSIFNQLFYFFGIVLWKKLSKSYKVLFVVLFLLEILIWYGRGTNFGITVLILLLFFNLLFFQKNRKIKRIALIVFPILSTFSFASLMESRRDGYEIQSLDEFDFTSKGIDKDSFVFDVLPPESVETYMYVLSYFTQGYYHTLIAMDMDFEFTYFFGNNPNLILFGEIVLGEEINKKTYVYRMRSYGVDPEINWHSAYTWIASDTTFFLMPFLFMFIGYIYGMSWKLSVLYNDLHSKVIFLVISIFLIFLFANNNFISSILYAFIFLIPYWYLTRIYKKEMLVT